MDLSYAEGWKPEPGDVLVGKVTDVGTGSSQFGGSYPIITVAPEGGGEAVAVHCFHAALYSRMMELRPEVGERIGIKYSGQEPHKTQPGKTVAKYIVKVDGRGAANVWGNLAAERQPAPPLTAPTLPEVGGAVVPQDDDIPF